MITLVAGIPAVVGSLGLSETLSTVIGVVRWPILAVIVALVLAALDRWAPDRDPAKWRWVSFGSAIATFLWLGGSILFSIYVENFSPMSKTYGPFAAVVILQLWLFLTAYIVLLGAEINSESEHQTAKDSTKGPSDPMGTRNAYHADHVAAEKVDEAEPEKEGFA